MPYLGADYRILTTDNGGRGYWWGTLITDHNGFGVAPVTSNIRRSKRLYYWLREEQPSKYNSLPMHAFT